MKNPLAAACLLIALIAVARVHGQIPAEHVGNPGVAAGAAEGDSEPIGQGPAVLSVGSLVFGAIVLSMVVLLRIWGGVGESSTFRLFGLTIVLTSGLFLIVAGYSQQQIAPMMGLLGTIAGYLLGKSDEAKGSAP